MGKRGNTAKSKEAAKTVYEAYLIAIKRLKDQADIVTSVLDKLKETSPQTLDDLAQMRTFLSIKLKVVANAFAVHAESIVRKAQNDASIIKLKADTKAKEIEEKV